MFAVGYVLQRGLLNFTLGTDDTRPIVVTFGLSIIIQNALLLKFSADEQGLDAGSIETASIHISKQLAIGWYPLLVFVLAVVVIAGRAALPEPHARWAGPSGRPPTTAKRPS